MFAAERLYRIENAACTPLGVQGPRAVTGTTATPSVRS